MLAALLQESSQGGAQRPGALATKDLERVGSTHGENAGSPNRSDAVDLAQPVRRCLDDVEHLVAEGAHELLGVDRANTADHAGREVLLDAVGRIGERGTEKSRLELLAVGAVVDPFARGGDPLTGRNGCGMADNGHNVTMPARLGA